MQGIKRNLAVVLLSLSTVFMGCATKSGGRPLTISEETKAKIVFDDKMDYDDIRIHDRHYINIAPFNEYVIAPNGHIYFGDPSDQNKGHTVSISDFARFMHEMTHVWQDQQGKNIPLSALGLWIKNGGDYDKSYKYDIDDKEIFSEMNMEQQASLVADYVRARAYMDREYKADSYKWGKLQNKTAREFLILAEAKLYPDMPINPTPGLPLAKSLAEKENVLTDAAPPPAPPQTSAPSPMS